MLNLSMIVLQPVFPLCSYKVRKRKITSVVW
jgi:hypothetical protein